MKHLLIFLIFALWSLPAAAITPQEGLYFNPHAPGRGVTLEIQEGILIATYFGYNLDGEAQWWQGTMTETADNTYQGDFAAFMDGQCFGCFYSYPDVHWDEVFFDAEIELLTSHSIAFTGPSETEILVKQNWAYEEDLDYVFGMWMLAAYDDSMVQDFSESIVFGIEIEGFDGDRIIGGHLSGYPEAIDRIAWASNFNGPTDDGEVIIGVETLDYSTLYFVDITEGNAQGIVTILDDRYIDTEFTAIGKQILNGYEHNYNGPQTKKALESKFSRQALNKRIERIKSLHHKHKMQQSIEK